MTLQVRHHLFQGFQIVVRVYGIFEVADLLPVGGDVFGRKAFARIETRAQAAFPAHLAHPAAAHFEQAGGFLAGFAGQVHHQRADEFGLELFEYLRRNQAFGHAGAASGGDGIDQDVVLAAFDGQGSGQAIEAKLGHAVVGLAEVAVDAGGGSGEDHPPVVLLTQVRPCLLYTSPSPRD